MMDFEGIEKVRQRVRQNGTLAQRLEQMQAQVTALLAEKNGSEKADGEPSRLSGPAENLSTRAAAMAMQKGTVK